MCIVDQSVQQEIAIGAKVAVDWQNATRLGEVIGRWSWPALEAKYKAIGIDTSKTTGMILVQFADIGTRVTPTAVIRTPFSEDQESVHRAGFERGLRLGSQAGRSEMLDEIRQRHPWLSRLLKLPPTVE